jgi:hypothetical protein
MDIEPLRQFAARFVGSRVDYYGRAVDMAMFSFGSEQTQVDSRRRGTYDVARFRLHVQAPWRLTAPDNVRLSSRDVWVHASSEATAPSEHDPPSPNVRDERLEELFDDEHHCVLESVVVTDDGDLTLRFDDGLRLDIFANGTSGDDEDYRWFDSDGDAYVVAGSQLSIVGRPVK